MRHPTRFQERTLWNAATGVAILVIGSLLVGLVWLIGSIFSFLQPVLVPLLVAGIVAYILDPVVRFLQRRGMSRLWSVVSVYVLLLIGIALLALALIPAVQGGREALQQLVAPAAKQTASAPANADVDTETEKQREKENLISNLAISLHRMRAEHQGDMIGWALTEVNAEGEVLPAPAMAAPNDLQAFWNSRIGRMALKYKGAIGHTAWSWISVGSSKILGLVGLVVGMIMVPVYLFFFLKDSAAISDHWHDYVPLKASRFKTELVDTLQEINGYLISFFRGQVLVGIIDGVLVGISLEIFGLPYGFLIGIFMALLGVIPYVGTILCIVPACVIAYLGALGGGAPFGLGPWGSVLAVVAIFTVVMNINSLVTAPKIVGDSVGLHPLTVIFSMLFWSLVLGGFVGALLAVPMTAAVKVVFRRYIWARQLREQTLD